MSRGRVLKSGEDTAIRVRSHYQREFAPGQLVVGAGERADHLFVIQSGEIELSREGPGAQRGAARLGPGDFFGELGVVLGERVPTRAIAVKPTRVLQLDRETLESMCLAQPEIARRNGERHTFFAGAHLRYGFHEDGLRSALAVAERLGVSGLEAAA